MFYAQPTITCYIRANQRQTFMKMSCFSAHSVGTKAKRTGIEYFAVDEQIDILSITEAWQSCQGDEARCVDMTPPDTPCDRSLLQPQDRWWSVFDVRVTVFDRATVTVSFPFSHSSFELAQLTVTSPQLVHVFCPPR